MKTLEFVLSTERLVSDLLDVNGKVVAFLKDWPEEFPPDVSKPHLEEDDVCYELEWYQGDHNSVVVMIRKNAETILFTSRGNLYKHWYGPTMEQVLEQVKWGPVLPGNLTRFWR